MKKLIPILLLISSCTTTSKVHYRNPKALHFTGKYTIVSRQGNTFKFKEVPGRYVIDPGVPDTLGPGKVITINVVHQ